MNKAVESAINVLYIYFDCMLACQQDILFCNVLKKNVNHVSFQQLIA